MKDKMWRTDGLPRGRYYIQAAVNENGSRELWHEGHLVAFSRGSAWRMEGRHPVMTVEAGPVEVGPDEIFRVGDNSAIRSLTLAEKPLEFAPQKLYTNKGPDLGSYFSISGVYSNETFAAKVRNLVGHVGAADVSVVVTDFYQRELGRAGRKGLAIDGETVISVPLRENTSGQYRAMVKVRDEKGREGFRVIPSLCDAKTAHRELVRMNMGWTRKVLFENGKVPADSLPPEAPAGLKEQSVTMTSAIMGPVAWFESRRTIPTSVSGKRLWVCIERLTVAADLYIDGKKAASFGFDGNENGHEADVTDFIRPGSEQRFVFVARKYKSICVPAIGEVVLEARPEVCIGDLRIETSYREKTISVAADCPSGHTIRNTVFLKNEKLISFADKAHWENPPLWGPFEFPLLRLVTELVAADGRVVDSKETRFGFREIWADGMALVWNGHRVKGDARAMQSTWSSWNFDRRTKRQNNCDVVWFNKRAGVKFLRHIYNSSEFIDFCDEAGLLVAKGGYTISGPSPDKDADDALWTRKYLNDEKMIAALRHHPSIMTWYLSNEYLAQSNDSAARRITEAVKRAIAYDPTRFAEAGCDIDMRGASQIVSTHYPTELYAFRNPDCFMPDCFYWRPIDKPFEKGMMVPCGQSKGVANVTYNSPIRWGEKPICINETCWDHFFAPPFGYTRIAGDDVFNGTSLLDKWHIRTNIEAMRGHRDAGAALWTPWRHLFADPIKYVSPEIDVVNIQRYHVFYSGTDVSYDVNAFYDVWKPDRLTWFWRLEDAAGDVVQDGAEEIHEVDTSAFFRKKMRFTAPERSGGYTLRFGFRGRREAKLDLTVCAREHFDQPANVIAASVPLATNLLSRAAAGETIVILAREDYPEWLPELPKVTQQSAAILRTFRPDHPVLDGISAKDLAYFHPKSIAAFHGFSKPSAGNARTVIEFGGVSGLAYSALLEVPYGKGAFLYSRLVLEPEVNPVAAKLLRNMAVYRCTSVPGKALFIAGGSEALAKALRQRCGVVCEEGRAADAARYPAVMLDGSIVLKKEEFAALAKSGRTVFVFNPGAHYPVKKRKMAVKAWQGRTVRVGNDPIMDGLTNQDLMWRSKYEDAKTAIANLGPEEFEMEKGALLYPVYAFRRRNFVFLTADPEVHHPSVDPLAKRFWATLFGNAGVAIRPFEKPRLPKNLFYTAIDLTPHLDRTITADEVDDDGKGSWMDQGKAQQLPMKFRHPTAWVGMVPYDVKKDGPGALALATENRKGGCSNIVLKIGRKIETVNWLWSSTWGVRGKRHYSATLHYADGTEATVLGVGGVNVVDCFTRSPDLSEETDTITSWKSFRTSNPVFQTANVYSTTYVNPHPERWVDSVEFVRGEKRCARVGIFAVTVGERTGGYEKMPAAERAALHDSLIAEAQSAAKAKDDERAIAAYEKALRVRPEMLGVYRSLGAIYEAERDWESALVTYRRSLEAEYNQPDMWDAEKAMLKKLGRTK
jgi:hypothetical protein